MQISKQLIYKNITKYDIDTFHVLRFSAKHCRACKAGEKSFKQQCESNRLSYSLIDVHECSDCIKEFNIKTVPRYDIYIPVEQIPQQQMEWIHKNSDTIMTKNIKEGQKISIFYVFENVANFEEFSKNMVSRLRSDTR